MAAVRKFTAVNTWYALRHGSLDPRTHVPIKIESGGAWVLEGRMGEGDAGYTLDSGTGNKLCIVARMPQVRVTGTLTAAYTDTPLDVAP